MLATKYRPYRCQFVYVNCSCSELRDVKCGVPQGNVLGPLLFLLYVNDIQNCVPSIPIKLYADDTNVFIHGNNIDAITFDAEDCIHNLNKWFVANKLSLSIDKTCLVHLAFRIVKRKT